MPDRGGRPANDVGVLRRPAWHDPLMVHRWGYTPHRLAALMDEVGLAELRQEPAQFKLREPRDMRIVGEKPSGHGPAPRTLWKISL